jgi:hypothetical protein
MTKRGKVGNMSLLSAVRITLRAAYNHPSMEGTAEVQAARLLAKELGLTRFGEQKKAKDRAALHRALDAALDADDRKICYKCNGSGQKAPGKKCIVCNGTGKTSPKFRTMYYQA